MRSVFRDARATSSESKGSTRDRRLLGRAGKAAAAGAGALILLAASPYSASAASSPDVDLRAVVLMKRQGVSYDTGVKYGAYINTSDVTSDNEAITLTGTPVTTTGDVVWTGASKLENNTDYDQTLTTQAFALQAADTLSTSSTKTVSYANKSSVSFGLGEALKIGVANEFTYTWGSSDTTTNTSSTTQIYTASAQSIKVPAHTTYWVSAGLQKMTTTGKVNLYAQLGGTYTCPIVNRGYACPSYKTDYSLYNTFNGKYTGTDVSSLGFTPNSVTKKVDFNGTGTYSATYGSYFTIKVSTSAPSTSTSSRNLKSLNSASAGKADTVYTYRVAAKGRAGAKLH
ncbi:ETX/MTX2 family pore-forming toxin [Streptomyces sp. NPDC127084]|uniref:ETX/MTX2 family pore-forming toxin n=1 Tax=Streptomyces sp. NPDC127084 TaxID=3347133 RepID=UPI0036664C5E